jgi:hypothetical protein
MHVHLRSFKRLVYFYRCSLINIKYHLYQTVKNFIRREKGRKITNSVIFFALKCQFKRFEFRPGRW